MFLFSVSTKSRIQFSCKRSMATNTANIKSIKRNKAHTSTLPTLIKHFIGYTLIVELKNNRSYTGTLDSSDQFMNVVLQSAAVSKSEALPLHSSTNEDCHYYNLIHIKGSHIRYIHFPSNLNLQRVIQASYFGGMLVCV